MLREALVVIHVRRPRAAVDKYGFSLVPCLVTSKGKINSSYLLQVKEHFDKRTAVKVQG